jgi:RecA/RadA recombinase
MPAKKKKDDGWTPEYPWRIDKSKVPDHGAPAATKKRMDEIRAKLKKEHKKVSIQPARDSTIPWQFLRRPFGLPTLDAASGGGVPPAGSTQIIGTPSVGKTTLAMKHLAVNQMIHGKDSRIYLAMTELGLVKKYGRALGFMVAYSKDEIERMEELREAKFTTEEKKWLQYEVGHVEILKAAKGYTPDLQDALVDLVDTNEFQTGIVDSLGGGATEDQIEKPSAARHPGGGMARTNTEFSHKLLRVFLNDYPDGRMNETCMLVINQARDDAKSNKRFMGQRTAIKHSGGNALLHQHLLNVELWRGPYVTKTQKVDGVEIKTRLGYNVYWEIMKGKCDCHEGERGSYVNYYSDDEQTMRVPGPDIVLDAIMQGIGGTISEAGWPKYHDKEGNEYKARTHELLAAVIDEAGKYWELYTTNARTLGFIKEYR